jgi:nucleoside-diphosphate-sugar epimerase
MITLTPGVPVRENGEMTTQGNGEKEMEFWKNKKVLVAGGAGFIGSYLTELLVKADAHVTVADNLSRGSERNLASIASKIRFMKADLKILDNCEHACADQDVVMNLAAPAFGVEYSMAHHGEMLTETVLIGFSLLEAARRKGVRRFLLVSSSCVYPDDAQIPTKEDEGWRGEPETINAGYGWGKRILELQAQYYAKEHAMDIAIVRPFNAYGARDHVEGDKAHVMPALICKALRGDDPIVVWGSGNQTRSFVHGLDFAQGLMLLTEHYAAADPVNLGHCRETSVRELAERIVTLTGASGKLVFDRTKPEGAQRKSADVSKLRGVTHGFVPEITLDQGLVEMIEYFRKLSDPGASSEG